MKSSGKPKRSLLRILFGACAGLCAIVVAFVVMDMRQAQTMAGEACKHAAVGMPVDAFLASVPIKGFRLIQGPNQHILVPKKGMGRYNCTVDNDGLRITNAQVNLLD